MKPWRTLSFFALAGALAAGAAGCSGQPAALDASVDAQDASPPEDAADASDAAPPAVPVSVATASGAVIGRDRGGYAEFLGIPYAAAPVGPLRFRPPATVAPWTTPREASVYGARCPQGLDPLAGSSAPLSEDCLTVNVYTPRADASLARPVMVWIHGGGFATGSNSAAAYQGTHFAADSNVVFVNFNYRLGALGFMAHPALVAEDTEHRSAGNYGFLDQVAALRWVRDNIRAFGGDPNQVTVFGESAGAMSTCGHLVSPLSRGLFQRAIMQSGTCSYLGQPLHDEPAGGYESGEAMGLRVAAALGCGSVSDVPACLRTKTPDEFLRVTPVLEALRTRVARFWPVIDGYVFPEAPWLAITASPPRIADVPVLLGTNREEADLLIINSAADTQADYEAAARGLFGANAAAAQAAYPLASYMTPRRAISAMYTDLVFTCATRAIASNLAVAGRRVFLYEFTRINPGARLLAVRASHGFEIPYVFQNFVAPFRGGGVDAALGRVMHGYWARFAITGDPSGEGAPQPWPAYVPAQDQFLEFGDMVTTVSGPREHRCSAIAPWIYPI